MFKLTGRSISFYFYLLLLLVGLVFYFVWSGMYGTWTDLGVYSVTVVMVGFGGLGVLLHMEEDEEGAEN